MEKRSVDLASTDSGGRDRASDDGGTQCKQNPDAPDHEWEMRTDWMGDPDVINGTVSWQVAVCRWCGIEQQEIDDDGR